MSFTPQEFEDYYAGWYARNEESLLNGCRYSARDIALMKSIAELFWAHGQHCGRQEIIKKEMER